MTTINLTVVVKEDLTVEEIVQVGQSLVEVLKRDEYVTPLGGMVFVERQPIHLTI